MQGRLCRAVYILPVKLMLTCITLSEMSNITENSCSQTRLYAVAKPGHWSMTASH